MLLKDRPFQLAISHKLRPITRGLNDTSEAAEASNTAAFFSSLTSKISMTEHDSLSNESVRNSCECMLERMLFYLLQ